MNLEHLPLEHQLIILGIQKEQTPELVQRIDELIDQNLNWMTITGLLFTHRIAGLFFHQLNNMGRSVPFKETSINLRLHSSACKEFNKEYTALVHQLTDSLEQNMIEYAVIKGPVLIHQIYQNPAIRISSDIDLLISPKQLSAATKVLTSLGFTQGSYDPARNLILPARRKETITWKTYTHQLLPFRKITNGELLDRAKVDVNFSWDIGQPGSDEALVTDLLKRGIAVDIGGKSVRTLSWEDFFLQLCIHITKEASAVWAVKAGTDVTLYKFCDLYYAYKCLPINWDKLIQFSITTQKVDAVYYAMFYTQMIFLDPGIEKLLEVLLQHIESREYLHELTDGRGNKIRHTQHFLERIFDFDRPKRMAKQEGALDVLQHIWTDGQREGKNA